MNRLADSTFYKKAGIRNDFFVILSTFHEKSQNLPESTQKNAKSYQKKSFFWEIVKNSSPAILPRKAWPNNILFSVAGKP
jgi:hypothetical protein